MRQSRLFITALLLSSFAIAQTTSGRLTGVVQDESIAVVAGARVTCVNNKTGIRSETVSDTRGFFEFASLPPAPYTITVEAKGFSTRVVQDFMITVAETANLIVTLALGDVKTTITVDAKDLPRVTTTDAQISQVITGREIDALPLGHEVLQVTRYLPGVAANGGADRVNGTRAVSNNVQVDGVDSNNPTRLQFGQTMTPANVDAVQEVRTILSGAKAEYGRGAGGQTQVITRSGGNAFHGNLFEYVRNDSFNANNFFSNLSGLPVPRLNQNYFGGSLGGAVVKNRTFFFVNTREKITKSESTVSRTVLTPTAKEGIFTYIPPGTTQPQTFNIVANDPRKLGINPEVGKILALLPDANDTTIGDGLNTSGYRFNTPSNAREYQFTLRADHNLTEKIRLFYRYAWLTAPGADGAALSTYPGQPSGESQTASAGSFVGVDWAFNARTLNEFRVGHQEFDSYNTRPQRVAGPMILSALFTDPLNTTFSSGTLSPVWSLNDSITRIQGRHTIKAGFSTVRTRRQTFNNAGIYPNVGLSRLNGNAAPTSIGPTGATITAAARQNFESLYNVILGRVSNVDQTFYSDLAQFQPAGTPALRDFIFHDFSGYVQDDFRVNRKLTLSFGLRYDVFGPAKEQQGLQAMIVGSERIDGFFTATDLAFQKSDRWYNGDHNNFAPRFGFAFDPFGTGKMAIRGSYGIFFDRIPDDTTPVTGAGTLGEDARTPGFVTALQVFPNSAGNTDIRLSDAYPVPAKPAAPTLQPPNTRAQATTIMNPNIRTPYYQNFSLGIQREVTRHMVLDLAYVGGRGVKLFQNRDLNQVRIWGDFLQSFKEIEAFRATGAAPPASNTLVRMFGTPALALSSLTASNFQTGAVGTVAANLDTSFNSRYAAAGVNPFYIRPYTQFTQLLVGTNDGRSYYNSLQMNLRITTSKMRHNISYTWAKTIDTGNGDVSVIVDAFNLRSGRGIADSSVPHQFTSTSIYTLPIGNRERFLNHLPKVLDSLIGGWDVSGIFFYQQGYPFSTGSGIRTTASSGYLNFSGDRTETKVEKRGDGVYLFTPAQVAQFSFPVAGELGGTSRNGFVGPHLVQFDSAIVKHFRIYREHQLTFRAEAQNTFNHANFAGFNTSLQTPATFGKMTVARLARNMILFLRYDF
ncbi:MAG TPA: TonB-dependent receptor [Bryobacteraceae bacterium]|nr:TonB-dependent receptor [Bryobacteraceae bacterium]